LSLVLKEFFTIFFYTFKGWKRSLYLIFNGKRKCYIPVRAFNNWSTSSCLFKQNTNTSIYVWIRRSFTIKKIVITFSWIIQTTNLVQCISMKLSNFSGYILIFFWSKRIHSLRSTRLKKIGFWWSHFMMVWIYIWFPFMKKFNAPFTFWVLCSDIITIHIKQIMIGSAIRPSSIMTSFLFIGGIIFWTI